LQKSWFPAQDLWVTITISDTVESRRLLPLAVAAVSLNSVKMKTTLKWEGHFWST